MGRLADTAKAKRKKPQMAKLVSENVEGDKSHTHSLARTTEGRRGEVVLVMRPKALNIHRAPRRLFRSLSPPVVAFVYVVKFRS